MKGIELSREYFEETGRKEILSQYPELMDKLAFGLCGSGSECLGYDDEVSTDHDFEPGFCIFIPGEDLVSRQDEFKLERLYARLPKEYKGFKRLSMSPEGGSRHGVIRMDEFFSRCTGRPDGEPDIPGWFSIPENSLLEATGGRIFEDNLGTFSAIRKKIAYLPEDVRLKKLAGELAVMAQSGQYNYERCLKHGETGAAQLALFEFVRSAIHVIYLINKKYMPYYKWVFRGLRDLERLSDLSDMLEVLISTGNEEELADGKLFAIGEITEEIVNELMEEGITKAVCYDLSKHAFSINDRIQDPSVRNADIFAGV